MILLSVFNSLAFDFKSLAFDFKSAILIKQLIYTCFVKSIKIR